MAATISIYHDTRRANKQGLFPVKLRLYADGKEKYYPVLHLKQKLFLFTVDFAKAYSDKARGVHKDYFLSMTAALQNAEEALGSMDEFSFELFDRLYTGRAGTGEITPYFQQVAAEKEKAGDIQTAKLYMWALASLQEFFGPGRTIMFRDITAKALNEYQEHMLNKGRSITTVGIYTRLLRAIFSLAMADGVVKESQLPFGRNRGQYKVPAGRKMKKALSHKQLGTLYNYDLSGKPKLQHARDFWFFSYVCNGMNFRDIAELKWRNFSGDSFVFIRSKTRKSSADNPQPIMVPVTDYVRTMLDKYANKDKSPDAYVFNIYKGNTDPMKKHNLLRKFIARVNKRLKPIAKELGFPHDFSTYYARHSFSTNVIRNGQSIEFVQKALGHTDMKTTMNYFAGFEDETLHSVNSKLLDFGEE